MEHEDEIAQDQQNSLASILRMQDTLDRLVNDQERLITTQKRLNQALYAPKFYNSLTEEQQKYIAKVVPKYKN